MALSVDKPLDITLGGFLDPLKSALLSNGGWIDFDAPGSALITNYCERAQTRLLEQFGDKPDLVKYICALITSFQELEFVYGDLLSQRSLDSASGVQLDGLGDIVGVERQGLSDDKYRDVIRFQAAINASNGEPESLITATKQLTGGTDVILTELFPARALLFTNGDNVSTEIVRQLEDVAPAGVALELISSYASTTPFAFEAEGTSDPDSFGYNEPNDPSSGGQYVEKFT